MDNLIYKDKGAFCPMCNRECEQNECVMFQRMGDKVGACHYNVRFFVNDSIADKLDRHNELLQFIAEQVAK